MQEKGSSFWENCIICLQMTLSLIFDVIFSMSKDVWEHSVNFVFVMLCFRQIWGVPAEEVVVRETLRPGGMRVSHSCTQNHHRQIQWEWSRECYYGHATQVENQTAKWCILIREVHQATYVGPLRNVWIVCSSSEVVWMCLLMWSVRSWSRSSASLIQSWKLQMRWAALKPPSFPLADVLLSQFNSLNRLQNKCVCTQLKRLIYFYL